MILLSSIVVFNFGCKSSKLASVNKVAVTGAQIEDYGIYEASKRGEASAPETSVGYIHTTSIEKLIKSTDHLPAHVGTSFGLHFRICGSPNESIVNGTICVIHPPTENPETGEKRMTEQWPLIEKIGKMHFSGFTFDKDWEIVPGKWTIQVWYGGKVIAEKKFIIEKS